MSSPDDGSVLLLTLGDAILAIALILVCPDGTSLYLAQKRLDSLEVPVRMVSPSWLRATLPQPN